MSGYKGRVYPINPHEERIAGLPVYRSVLDIPDEIGLAVITIRAEQVPQALRECIQKGIRAAVVISAGFAETGSRGSALQEEITETARRGSLAFVGPNTMGIWSAASDLNLARFDNPNKGSIGFISQSGTLGGMFAQVASSKGYGLSKFVSIGNQASLDAADYLEYFATDSDTKAIILYLEGFSDGRKLFRAGSQIAGQKPVIVYKAGKNQSIARVAMSHTAAIAGEDRIFNAMCRQVGFIRADDLYGSLDMAAVLTQQPLPRGNRVGIIGTGGQCVVLSDTCVSMGLQIPELRQEDVSFIISGIDFPPHAPTPRNPVDFAAGSRTALNEAQVLNRLAQLDYIDCLICNTPVTFHHAARTSTAEQERLDTEAGALLGEIPKKYQKPVVTLGFAKNTYSTGLLRKALDDANIPSFSTPEETVRAMYALWRYQEIKQRFDAD